MSITVNTQAQAATLREIDRWTEYLDKELQKVASDTSAYMAAIANGECCYFAPDTTKVKEYAAKRDALLELTSVLDIKTEWLQTALKGGRAFYTVAE